MKQLHDGEMAHLDLKPDNIVFTDNYMSKLIDMAHCDSTRMPLSTKVGTFKFAPPEVLPHLLEKKKRIPFEPKPVDIFNIGGNNVLVVFIKASQISID